MWMMARGWWQPVLINKTPLPPPGPPLPTGVHTGPAPAPGISPAPHTSGQPRTFHQVRYETNTKAWSILSILAEAALMAPPPPPAPPRTHTSVRCSTNPKSASLTVKPRWSRGLDLSSRLAGLTSGWWDRWVVI
jgi:hypothetical protein